ncbi:MAG: class I SAM-dependent methyltransferase [Rhodospirillales bacterium]|nr:class I SAM-dependent methyltransferase [Rhodospirillales bacterium]MBO6788042.1 class I SAM-dependent methyltransferase [Rhodospirillales bacterium]
MTEPSDWFATYLPLVPEKGTVLDVAAGSGRHAKMFAEAGHPVTAIDRNTEALQPLNGSHDVEIVEADLENGSPWPLPGRTFDAVVVSNYLFRPLFGDLIRTLAPGGVLLYETFALGNEVYSRPRNPDHLLKSGELLTLVQGRLQVVAYRHGIVEGGECPGVKQMICAVNNLDMSDRDDGEPEPRPLP